MNKFLKYNLEMPVFGGYGGGSGGGSGSSVNGGNIDNNKITLTKDDNTSIVLDGEMEVASEAVGDARFTVRKDVSTQNYREVDEFADIIYDKIDEPLLWEQMKEWQENSLSYDINNSFFNANIISPVFGNVTVDSDDSATSIFNWKGKWIRTVYVRFGVDYDYFQIFQVSDSLNFNTFREYVIKGFHDNSGRFCYIPEKNVIFIIDYKSRNVLMFEINDADDLIDYSEINYGGNKTKTPTVVRSQNLNHYLNISSDPNNQNCYLNIYDIESDRGLSFANLEDILNGNYTFQRVSESKITNDGYDFQSLKLFMSMNKIFFVDNNTLNTMSYNIDTQQYTIENNGSGLTSAYIIYYSYDGCLCLKTNLETYIINTHKDENTFKQINKININSVENNDTINTYYPKFNVMIFRTSDVSGMTLDENASKTFFVSYDDGQTWNQFFYDPYRTDWVSPARNIDSTRSKSDFIDLTQQVYQASFDQAVRRKTVLLTDFQEEGYSDLFTIKSLNLNYQVKAYLKRQ